MNKTLKETYRRLRSEDRTLRASVAIQWAREKAREASWRLRNPPDPERPVDILLPHGYKVVAHVDYDEFGNPWEYIETKWTRGGYFSNSDDYRFGKMVEIDRKGEWYSTGWTDRDSCLLVRLDYAGGADRASRARYWSSQGYSRSDADLLARQSIRKELDYYRSMASGDVATMCIAAILYDSRGVELDKEACCGFEVGYSREDRHYLLAALNGFVEAMVRSARKHEDELSAAYLGL